MAHGHRELAVPRPRRADCLRTRPSGSCKAGGSTTATGITASARRHARHRLAKAAEHRAYLPPDAGIVVCLGIPLTLGSRQRRGIQRRPYTEGGKTSSAPSAWCPTPWLLCNTRCTDAPSQVCARAVTPSATTAAARCRIACHGIGQHRRSETGASAGAHPGQRDRNSRWTAAWDGRLLATVRACRRRGQAHPAGHRLRARWWLRSRSAGLGPNR